MGAPIPLFVAIVRTFRMVFGIAICIWARCYLPITFQDSYGIATLTAMICIVLVSSLTLLMWTMSDIRMVYALDCVSLLIYMGNSWVPRFLYAYQLFKICTEMVPNYILKINAILPFIGYAATIAVFIPELAIGKYGGFDYISSSTVPLTAENHDFGAYKITVNMIIVSFVTSIGVNVFQASLFRHALKGLLNNAAQRRIAKLLYTSYVISSLGAIIAVIGSVFSTDVSLVAAFFLEFASLSPLLTPMAKKWPWIDKILTGTNMTKLQELKSSNLTSVKNVLSSKSIDKTLF